MKNLFTLLISTLALFTAQLRQADAQSINLQYAGDSTFTGHCSVTDTIEFAFYGQAVGFSSSDSVDMSINFGDGIDTLITLPIIQGSWISGFAHHVYSQAGAYNVQFIMTGPNGAADTIVDQVLIATTCAEIEGKIYLDGNGDCLYSPGETGIQTFIVASYNGNEISGVMSDVNGDYYLSVPAGFSYTVSILNSNFNITCPSSGIHTVTTLPATNIDFGLACDPQVDLTGNVIGVGFRTNANTTLGITAMNKILSCASPVTTITLTLDPMLSYVSSSLIPSSVSGNTIVYTIGSLTGISYYEFSQSITVLTNIAANVGDTLCITMVVDPIAGDADPSDNTIVICLPVRNSLDPNEKSESHVGLGTGIVAPNTELDYTILFQNLGNDDAYEIIVEDEIDANLDLSSLRVTGMSHPGQLYITGRTLKFEFNNINLPAASVNEPESHGWITYSIRPNAGLPLGTAVNNYADIYFDFNAAVVTNTVTDVFDIVTGIQSVSSETVNVYPNPAQDYFTVSLPANTDAVMDIMDMSGRSVISGKNIKGQELINIQSFQPGIYTIRVIANGKQMTSKLSVK